MGKDDPTWREIFSYAGPPTNTGKPRERTTSNVHDDSVWGKHWGEDRKRALKELEEDRAEAKRRGQAMEEQVELEHKLRADRLKSNPDGPFQWARWSTAGTKYHVAPDGRAMPCKAGVRACPYGQEDHFGVEAGARLDPQKVASWIVERRETANALTTKVELDPALAENPRLVAKRARETANKRGAIANIIELEATIDVNHYDTKPIKISRQIGNTLENRWADHAYWVLDDGNAEHKLMADRMTDGDIDNFVKYYLFANAQQADPAIREEIRAELTAQIKHLILASEGEAAQGNEASAHHSVVPVSFADAYERTDQEASARINYASSGFEPHHLKAWRGNFRGIHTTKHVRLTEGFEVYDTDAGEGKARWRMVKGPEGWTITVQGSRGDVALFQTSDPEEGRAFMADVYGRRVKARGADRGRYFGEPAELQEASKAEALEARAGFVEGLLREDLSREPAASAPQEEQGTLFDMEPADSPAKKSGLGKLFKHLQ